METPKPEDVENQLNDVKVEAEKAEVAIRRLDRNSKELTIKDVLPNKTYEKNGYTYQTDSHACPVRVSGYLHLGDGGRTPQGTEIGRMGNLGDKGGHIIGKQFEGPTDAFNIRPQDGNFNKHEYLSLETEWANALKAGKQVKVDIDLHYGDNTIRPDEYTVTYEIISPDGKSEINSVIFKNQARQG